ncbi:hypothetical protein H0G86_000686 [Trichoderma simmonsii]|uniref:Uncharacterized protein n=1 Tax=Trichoderma simmonsii TaxID=1491479 RepID=A0A8G0L042_9HYPO|nr:hypothetical protein H0G86_000686 [Trichoderma simmonsii]
MSVVVCCNSALNISFVLSHVPNPTSTLQNLIDTRAAFTPLKKQSTLMLEVINDSDKGKITKTIIMHNNIARRITPTLSSPRKRTGQEKRKSSKQKMETGKPNATSNQLLANNRIQTS